MEMKLVGKEKVDYVSKKSGNPVVGLQLHSLYKSDRADTEGEFVERIFVSSKSPMYEQVCRFPLGCNFSVQYNRWGSVESVTLCK